LGKVKVPKIIDSYWTVAQEYGPIEIKEKASRFLSLLFPVTGRGHADTIIKELKKKYHDSNHVCFAYCLGKGREDYFRYNDDGEPSGTAGLPILKEIRAKQYFNVLVAVVRYFGGIKLGTGGLARAYGEAAKQVLNISSKCAVHLKRRASLNLPHEFTGDIMYIINRFNLDITQQEYTDEGLSMQFDIPIKLVGEVKRVILERSKGKLKPVMIDQS
jgi:uncharacterized YigZ family protein